MIATRNNDVWHQTCRPTYLVGAVLLNVIIWLGACVPSSEPPEAPFRIAVLGDSLSTGAATHPALQMDAKRLWEVFQGKIDVRAQDTELELPPPQRLWPARREFFGGADWVHRHLMQLVSRRFLDTEEYTWAYALARATLPGSVDEQARQLVIAAEDGAKTEALPMQLERVLQASGGRLPEKLFVFYTGNDLCGLALSQTTSESEYRRALRAGIQAILRAPAAKAGSQVYILGHLGVTQLAYEPDILAKPVYAYGEMSSCRALRERGFEPPGPNYDPGLPEDARWFAMLMPPNPAAYCPTLFGAATPEQERSLQAIANRIRAFREIQAQVVADLSANPMAAAPSPVRLHYVADTANLQFAADDIAEDCFHLSRQGQQKLATAVLSYLNRVDSPR